MTRTEIAARILAGLVANPNVFAAERLPTDPPSVGGPSKLAGLALQLADALIAQEKKA